MAYWGGRQLYGGLCPGPPLNAGGRWPAYARGSRPGRAESRRTLGALPPTPPEQRIRKPLIQLEFLFGDGRQRLAASLLPSVARISQYAEAPADFGVYQGAAGGGDYVPRLAHVLEAEIADDMQDASEEEEANFDDDDDKKRSVLSWFRRG